MVSRCSLIILAHRTFRSLDMSKKGFEFWWSWNQGIEWPWHDITRILHCKADKELINVTKKPEGCLSGLTQSLLKIGFAIFCPPIFLRNILPKIIVIQLGTQHCLQ